jgi:hypothetical protein
MLSPEGTDQRQETGRGGKGGEWKREIGIRNLGEGEVKERREGKGSRKIRRGTREWSLRGAREEHCSLGIQEPCKITGNDVMHLASGMNVVHPNGSSIFSHILR